MGWVEQLDNQVVGLDTAPLIYFIEENPIYIASITPFFEALAEQQFSVVTSTITLLEVLIHPIRSGSESLATQYRQILAHSQGVTLTSISPQVAENSAHIRAKYNIRTPDAIQLAAAISSGATFFLSNDIKLKQVSEINVLILDELA